EMMFALLSPAVASNASFGSSFAVWAWQQIARVAFKVNPIIRIVPFLKIVSIIEGTPPSPNNFDCVYCRSRRAKNYAGEGSMWEAPGMEAAGSLLPQLEAVHPRPGV